MPAFRRREPETGDRILRGASSQDDRAGSRRAGGPRRTRRSRSMPSQKLVRCEIRRRGSAEPGSPRFVPLEIYGLWEYLMSSKHDFEVAAPLASLWLDMEDSPEAAYSENQFERVTEVTVFVYSDRDDMFTRVCRYFPSADCETVKKIFLSHYERQASSVRPQIRERAGIWLHRPGAATATA
jgi:hypothetical protein